MPGIQRSGPTMSLLQHRWLRRDMEKYRDLTCGAAPGTHAEVVQLLQRQVPPPHAGVIDLGAGSGALLRRLQDAGFVDLHGADLSQPRWTLTGVPYTRTDLDGPFSRAFQRKFRVACLSETLEHLESPRQALMEVRELLEADGYLIITLPNVAFWEGRLKFALTGELWGFGENNYREIRHISPLTRDQLRLMLQEIGFRVIAATTTGSYATPLRRILFAPLWLPLAAVAGREVLGECIVVLAQKAPADPGLSHPSAPWVWMKE